MYRLWVSFVELTDHQVMKSVIKPVVHLFPNTNVDNFFTSGYLNKTQSVLT